MVSIIRQTGGLVGIGTFEDSEQPVLMKGSDGFQDLYSFLASQILREADHVDKVGAA